MGGVVFTAQVSQNHIMHPGVQQLHQGIRTGIIAQVPVVAQNALLQCHGVMGIGTEHIRVMVAFQQHQIAPSHSIADPAGKLPQVRGGGNA